MARPVRGNWKKKEASKKRETDAPAAGNAGADLVDQLETIWMSSSN
jgi:hypothetical protein